MNFLHALVFFIAGAFLANGVPHFVNGISGKHFQTPFASPPGVGESSPTVNVLWGFFNFVVGYILLVQIGDFTGGLSPDLFFTAAGALLMAIFLSSYFAKVMSKYQ